MPRHLKCKTLQHLLERQDRHHFHELVLALHRVPSLCVVAGLWPVDLVGRAVLCPPCQGSEDQRARSDARYLQTARRAVATV